MTAGPWTVVIPGLALASNNASRREHWTTQRARATAVKNQVGWNLVARVGRPPPALPLVVTITRISTRLFDGDNWIGGDAKCVRDAIAAYLNTHDKDRPELQWRYEQERGAVALKIGIARPTPSG